MAEYTSQEMILRLLNEKNLPYRDFDKVNVRLEAMTPSMDQPDANTKFLIGGVPGRGYSGQESIYYRRISLTELEGFSVRSENGFDQQVVLDRINQGQEVFLTLDDLEPFVVPDVPGAEPVSLFLQAREDSWGWLDSCEVQLQYGKQFLDTAIRKPNLTVFRHPVANLARKSARMLTWGVDFSSIQDAIKPVRGQYTDIAKLKEAFTLLGIPTSWSGNTVSDRLTSALPTANQKFERVVTQSISSNYMVGSLYLHYNPL